MLSHRIANKFKDNLICVDILTFMLKKSTQITNRFRWFDFYHFKTDRKKIHESSRLIFISDWPLMFAVDSDAQSIIEKHMNAFESCWKNEY